jgi:hypothetical protein
MKEVNKGGRDGGSREEAVSWLRQLVAGFSTGKPRGLSQARVAVGQVGGLRLAVGHEHFGFPLSVPLHQRSRVIQWSKTDTVYSEQFPASLKQQYRRKRGQKSG